MARPKSDPNKLSATDRIEKAFWEMLENGPYSDITIANLARQANVNHNTIYYYFENIDDMATKLFNKNIPMEIPRAMLTFANSGYNGFNDLLCDQQVMKRWMQARLFIRGDSAFLTNCYKKSIINTWLNTVKIKQEDLSDKDRIVIEFIFSGLIAVIGSPIIGENPKLLQSMMELNMGQEILSALSQIAHGER